ncbi:hypothetical protein [Nitrospirillum amazonense]|uniref:hypothetical protein n=1 Tax=Nitrospirillum amazonense TaxID=28077 RepID=UPI0016445F7A|nr:hypothetical protein [Nitrospirillum amazonense]
MLPFDCQAISSYRPQTPATVRSIDHAPINFVPCRHGMRCIEALPNRQGGPGDARQFVGERHHHGVLVASAHANRYANSSVSA